MYLQKNYRALINESSTRRMINKNLNLVPHSGNVLMFKQTNHLVSRL